MVAQLNILKDVLKLDNVLKLNNNVNNSIIKHYFQIIVLLIYLTSVFKHNNV